MMRSFVSERDKKERGKVPYVLNCEHDCTVIRSLKHNAYVSSTQRCLGPVSKFHLV